MEKELRILMVEDLEEDAGLMDLVLRKENVAFTRIRVDSRQKFIEALDVFKPDIILSDHALPQFNSIEALKIVLERNPDIPFVLVTGTVSEEFAVSCLKKGADDYVLKSNLSRLPSAIKNSLNDRQNKRIRVEQEEALRNQNTELIKTNEELDSFVYSISHNLRSPLASVLGLVNIAKLDHSKRNGSIDHYFDMIGSSVLKLDDTLKEILDYSRNSRTKLEITEINLAEMFNECFAQLNYLKNFSVIEKQLDIQNETPFYSDHHRLSVLISNILSNSIKYMDGKKANPFIQIKTSVSPTQLVMNILDNGLGIHPDYLQKVFKMFFRACESSDGAGLGLYIVKEVIGKLNGTIEITSVYGEQTNVEVIIPNANK